VAWLSDTNILLRMAQPSHPMYEQALQAVERLLERGEQVCIVPQNITEFWNVATRREGSANGLGMTVAEAHEEVRRISTFLTLLPDTERIYPEWLDLVVTHSVSDIDVYDARLVAAMRVYGVSNLLTFDVHDFARYPDIHVLQPADVLKAYSP
jgi:predicted nucleic acid-binding protein